ncbi:MAG: phage tail tape measure protein [Aeromonas sp.]
MSTQNLQIRVALSAANQLSTPLAAAQRSANALGAQLASTQGAITSLGRQAKSFDKLNAASSRTRDALAATKAQAQAMRAAFGAAGQRTEEQSRQLAQLRGRVSQLNREYQTQQTRLGGLRSGLMRHGVLLRGSASASDQVARRTEQYNRQLADQQRRLDAANRAQARFNRSQALAGKLASGGAAAMAGGGLALAGAGQFIAPGLEFDAAMSQVQALARVDKSSTEYAALRDQARQLGATTAFSATDAASGQKFLAMAGFTPDAVQAALPGVLDMAMAGGVELGQAADIASNILSQFGLQASEMDRLGDSLVATFTRANTSLFEVGEAMKYAGTVGAQFGVDAERMSAMVGKLADAGIKGSMAGTALKTVIANLHVPTNAAQAALDELGVSFVDASGKPRDFAEAMGDLQRAMAAYSEVDQASFAKDISGEEAFGSLLTLLKTTGDGSLGTLERAIRGAGGEAAKNAKVMSDNLAGDLKSMSSAWSDLRIELSESVDSPLRSLAQDVTELISSVGRWMQQNPAMVKGLALVGGGLAAAAVAVGSLALTASAALGPLALLRLSLTTLGGSGGMLSAVMAAGRAAVMLLGGSLGLLLSPIGAVIAAVAALALAVYLHWEPIKAWFTGFWSGLKAGMAPVLPLFAAWSPVIDAISSAVGRLWQWFTQLFTPVDYTVESLGRASEAGASFGRIVGAGISHLITLAAKLAEGLSWVLTQLGLMPEASKKAQALLPAPSSSALPPPPLFGATKALAPPSLLRATATTAPAQPRQQPSPPPAALARAATAPLAGTKRRNVSAEAAASAMPARANVAASEAARGAIVFKNLPAIEALRGQYREPTAPPVTLAPKVQVQPASTAVAVTPYSASAQPVSGAGATSVVVNVTVNEAGQLDERQLARQIQQQVSAALAQNARRARSSYRDRD